MYELSRSIASLSLISNEEYGDGIDLERITGNISEQLCVLSPQIQRSAFEQQTDSILVAKEKNIGTL